MTEDLTAGSGKKFFLLQSLLNPFVTCTVCYLIITKGLFPSVWQPDREATSTFEVMNIAPHVQLLIRLHDMVLNSAHEKP